MDAREDPALGFTPFTMAAKLCDDDGIVRPGQLVDGVHVPYPCTSHAHRMGEHIRCTSPAHEPTPIVVVPYPYHLNTGWPTRPLPYDLIPPVTG